MQIFNERGATFEQQTRVLFAHRRIMENNMTLSAPPQNSGSFDAHKFGRPARTSHFEHERAPAYIILCTIRFTPSGVCKSPRSKRR
jgi:hypothetical protein